MLSLSLLTPGSSLHAWALAQLFVLRDHMEVAGRGLSGADPVLEPGAPPFCVGLAKPLVYLALPSSLLS